MVRTGAIAAVAVGILGVSWAAGSRSRHNFADTAEVALNTHINLEYSAGYQYAAMSAYFSRDDVALLHIGEHFEEASKDEFAHGRALSKYLSQRGGRLVLDGLSKPEQHEFEATETKSDALVAFESALALEKKVLQSLLELSELAAKNNDPQMADHIDEYLKEQVEAIDELAKYVAQLTRIGADGLGAFVFDKEFK